MAAVEPLGFNPSWPRHDRGRDPVQITGVQRELTTGGARWR
uniref:Uncharacterized protein n=1 Tax=Arundo donax TaxID=35708 RepID=A0A0A9HME2_ARUDO